jgi:cytochrome P450
LVFAEVDGERLSEVDLVEFCIMLMAGGHETTTNLIGNAIYSLLEHPVQLALLQERPELIPQVVEETLRYRSPIQCLFRVALQDVELGGQQIRQGERVIAYIASANRDEAKYPDSERFDITRAPGQLISFGHGIHFCLGAPLARLEGRVALGALLERLADLRIDPQATLELTPNQVVFGLKSLPLLFTPRPQ